MSVKVTIWVIKITLNFFTENDAKLTILQSIFRVIFFLYLILQFPLGLGWNYSLLVIYIMKTHYWNPSKNFTSIHIRQTNPNSLGQSTWEWDTEGFAFPFATYVLLTTTLHHSCFLTWVCLATAVLWQRFQLCELSTWAYLGEQLNVFYLMIKYVRIHTYELQL